MRWALQMNHWTTTHKDTRKKTLGKKAIQWVIIAF